jgi:hypothetical protein
MFDISPEVVAIAIPVLATLGIFAAIITGIVINGRQKELQHQERMSAMEKGIPIPEPPKVEKRPAYKTLRVWGLVLGAIGLGALIGITAEAGIRHGLWGGIPLLAGIAFLISANIEKSENGSL